MVIKLRDRFLLLCAYHGDKAEAQVPSAVPIMVIKLRHRLLLFCAYHGDKAEAQAPALYLSW
jgi:hypothetical protein